MQNPLSQRALEVEATRAQYGFFCAAIKYPISEFSPFIRVNSTLDLELPFMPDWLNRSHVHEKKTEGMHRRRFSF